MTNLLMTACLLLTVSACSSINKELGLKDDNDLEQRVEEVIEKETGVKVDLTPTKETSKKSLDQEKEPKKDKKIGE